MDNLTILTTDARHSATKRHRLADEGWQTVPYAAGAVFTWGEAAVGGIEDIARIIEGIGYRSFLIRGAIHEDKRSEKILHRRCENFGGKRGATPRQWVMIDLDNLTLPDVMDLSDDPEMVIEWAIYECLPKPFHDVTCFWQLSASAGIKPGLSVHVFFWLDRPVAGGPLADYLAVKGRFVDLSVIRGDVQPHFVAPPIFENAPDPIPLRQSVMDREYEFVTIPPLDETALREEAKTAGSGSGLLAVAGSLDERLSLMGDGPGLAGFHEPIRTAIMGYISINRLQVVDDEALKNRVREAIHRAPQAPGRDVSNYLSDQYLDASVTGARRRKEENFRTDTAPFRQQDTVSLAEGEAKVKEGIAAFFIRVLESHNNPNATPPLKAIGTTPGIGKSFQMVAAIARLAEALPEERIHIYVGTGHVLVDDLWKTFSDTTDAETKIYRGRAREELTVDGEPMCYPEMHKIAEEYEKAWIPVTNLCKKCKFNKRCGTARQRADKGPGIRIMPAEYAFLPTAQQASIQVFDESFWKAAIRETSLDLGTLHAAPVVPLYDAETGYSIGERDPFFEESLAAYRQDLSQALIAAKGGVPTIPQLHEAGITILSAAMAEGIELQRAIYIQALFNGKTDPDEAKRIRESFQHADARAWAGIWGSIKQQISLPRTRLHGLRRWERKPEDGGVEMLKAMWTADVQKPDIPTLILDGTLDETILRRFFPKLADVEQVDIEIPSSVTVRQIADRAISKGMIAPNWRGLEDKKVSEEELKRQQNNARRLRHITEVKAAKAAAEGKKIGLVTYKATEEEIKAGLPENVLPGHFNKTRGLNDWNDVCEHTIAGRPLPRAADVELLAEAIHYKLPEQINATGKYVTVLRSYTIRGGTFC